MAGKLDTSKVKIVFAEKEVAKVHPHNDDPKVITIQYDDYEMSFDWPGELRLNVYDLKPFQGS